MVKDSGALFGVLAPLLVFNCLLFGYQAARRKRNELRAVSWQQEWLAHCMLLGSSQPASVEKHMFDYCNPGGIRGHRSTAQFMCFPHCVQQAMCRGLLIN